MSKRPPEEVKQTKLLCRRGKVINAEAREIISNVIDFMESESSDGLTIPLRSVKERVLKATGISRPTYYRIRQERQDIRNGLAKCFITPRLQRPRCSPKSNISDADKLAIRNVIMKNFMNEDQSSLKQIHKKILDDGIHFKGSTETLRKILLSLGFRWVKTENNARKLCIAHNFKMEPNTNS